jgi:hypothetical protein
MTQNSEQSPKSSRVRFTVYSNHEFLYGSAVDIMIKDDLSIPASIKNNYKRPLTLLDLSRLRNIITEIRDNPEGITSAFYADEVVGVENPLSVRTRHLSQLDNIQNKGLREYLRERYAVGDESRFKNVMDVSSIDGAQYIDGDMRNLLLTVLAEPDP